MPAWLLWFKIFWWIKFSGQYIPPRKARNLNSFTKVLYKILSKAWPNLTALWYFPLKLNFDREIVRYFKNGRIHRRFMQFSYFKWDTRENTRSNRTNSLHSCIKIQQKGKNFVLVRPPNVLIFGIPRVFWGYFWS